MGNPSSVVGQPVSSKRSNCFFKFGPQDMKASQTKEAALDPKGEKQKLIGPREDGKG